MVNKGGVYITDPVEAESLLSEEELVAVREKVWRSEERLARYEQQKAKERALRAYKEEQRKLAREALVGKNVVEPAPAVTQEEVPYKSNSSNSLLDLVFDIFGPIFAILLVSLILMSLGQVDPLSVGEFVGVVARSLG